MGGERGHKGDDYTVTVGDDENGLTGAHMLLLLLKCLFSTYRFDTGAGK